jgi:hypothetical protein
VPATRKPAPLSFRCQAIAEAGFVLCDKLAPVPDRLADLNPAHAVVAAVVLGPVIPENEGATSG